MYTFWVYIDVYIDDLYMVDQLLTSPSTRNQWKYSDSIIGRFMIQTDFHIILFIFSAISVIQSAWNLTVEVCWLTTLTYSSLAQQAACISELPYSMQPLLNTLHTRSFSWGRDYCRLTTAIKSCPITSHSLRNLLYNFHFQVSNLIEHYGRVG